MGAGEEVQIDAGLRVVAVLRQRADHQRTGQRRGSERLQCVNVLPGSGRDCFQLLPNLRRHVLVQAVGRCVGQQRDRPGYLGQVADVDFHHQFVGLPVGVFDRFGQGIEVRSGHMHRAEHVDRMGGGFHFPQEGFGARRRFCAGGAGGQRKTEQAAAQPGQDAAGEEASWGAHVAHISTMSYCS